MMLNNNALIKSYPKNKLLTNLLNKYLKNILAIINSISYHFTISRPLRILNTLTLAARECRFYSVL